MEQGLKDMELSHFKKRYYELMDEVETLKEKNSQLQQRIDKARVIIENYTTLNPERVRQELLDILKLKGE